jgi:hypothetical protein
MKLKFSKKIYKKLRDDAIDNSLNIVEEICSKEDTHKNITEAEFSSNIQNESINEKSFNSSLLSFHSLSDKENPIAKSTTVTPSLIAFNLHNISKFLYNSQFRNFANDDDICFMEKNTLNTSLQNNDPK